MFPHIVLFSSSLEPYKFSKVGNCLSLSIDRDRCIEKLKLYMIKIYIILTDKYNTLHEFICI